jgi:hypothetical protein
MMDRETIIKLAREAGFPIPKVPAGELEPALLSVVERFAKLVRDDYSFTHAQLWIKRINDAVAAEREACAKVADGYIGADPIAAAIRARSNNA